MALSDRSLDNLSHTAAAPRTTWDVTQVTALSTMYRETRFSPVDAFSTMERETRFRLKVHEEGCLC